MTNTADTTEHPATLLLDEIAVDRVAATVRKLLADGIARWLSDPQVAGVHGLSMIGGPAHESILVVYMDAEDFEESVEFAHFRDHY